MNRRYLTIRERFDHCPHQCRCHFTTPSFSVAKRWINWLTVSSTLICWQLPNHCSLLIRVMAPRGYLMKRCIEAFSEWTDFAYGLLQLEYSVLVCSIVGIKAIMTLQGFFGIMLIDAIIASPSTRSRQSKGASESGSRSPPQSLGSLCEAPWGGGEGRRNWNEDIHYRSY